MDLNFTCRYIGDDLSIKNDQISSIFRFDISWYIPRHNHPNLLLILTFSLSSASVIIVVTFHHHLHVVFKYQMILYARACSAYDKFSSQGRLLRNKLMLQYNLKQGQMLFDKLAQITNSHRSRNSY
jgi:hypothetical protein